MARKPENGIYEKVEYHILRIVMSVLFLTGVTKFLTLELGSLKEFVNTDNLRPLIPYLALALAAGALLFALINVFVYLLRKRNSQSNSLRSLVVKAYIGALQESSLKPQRRTKDHL